jgi:subtilisin-like proprotein convertase family protein
MVTTIEFNMEADPYRPHVSTIEQVVLRIGHDVINQEGVCVEIVSPSKTTSVIVDNTDGKNIDQDNAPRDLTSVHFLGESPVGNWTVRIHFGQKSGN